MNEINNILANTLHELAQPKVTINTLAKVLSDACVDSYLEGRFRMKEEVLDILIKNGVDKKVISEIHNVIVSCP
jgi:hypothetical protein